MVEYVVFFLTYLPSHRNEFNYWHSAEPSLHRCTQQHGRDIPYNIEARCTAPSVLPTDSTYYFHKVDGLYSVGAACFP
jgi:hypothetical protein